MEIEHIETPLIVPPGKVTGCLPRTTQFGEICEPFASAIEVISRDKWAGLIGRVDLRPQVKVVLDQDGVGCHDDKTQVLTETGWQAWSDYDRKAALGTINPTTHALEFQFPSVLHAYEYDGPLHTIDHRSMSMAVTPNHRMLVRGWNESKRKLNKYYEIRNADSVGWYGGLLSAPTGFNGTEIDKVTVGGNKYSGDDFLSLVSLVASDGWIGGSESTFNRVSFCCFRDDRIDMVRALAFRVGFRELSNRPGVWEQRNPSLAEWLRVNLFAGTILKSPYKRVPAIVKCVSMRQIKLFLEFYGDQHVAKSRRQFYTSSPQMADGLQELLLRIGKRSGIYSREPRDTVMRDGRRIEAKNCHNDHTVTEWTSSNLSIEQKKVGINHYKGMVYCATVPNSLLVTRRNGKVLISGNSCATEAAAGAAMIVRATAGQSHVLLNPWSIYRVTSGGRDGGSNIDSNLAFARDTGILPEEYWPRSKGWRATPPSGWEQMAAKYRIAEFYDCANSAEIGTALLLGFPVVFGWSGHSCVLTSLLSPTVAAYLNSWGNWGDQGFGKIKLNSINYGYGAWALRVMGSFDGGL